MICWPEVRVFFMSSDLRLDYSELIAPKRYVKILSPNEIPVHPKVYESEFAYTQKFADEVKSSVPDSMKKDISEIERILGLKFGFDVTDCGLKNEDGIILYENIDVAADSKRKCVEVSYFSSNIAINNEVGFGRFLQYDASDFAFPTGLEKLKKFSLPCSFSEGIKVPAWYVHNHLDHGNPLMLYFRNFAIMFNNLGIKRK